MFFLQGFHPQNVALSCLIFHEKILPVIMELLLTVKINPGLDMCTSVQELRSSLHV